MPALPPTSVRADRVNPWLNGAKLSFALWIMGLLILVHMQPGVSASPDERTVVLERSVKAAFLYKFLGYVEWTDPAAHNSSGPLVIGVIDADDIASELTQSLSDRTINNRPLVVKRVSEGGPLSGLNLLFVGGSGGYKFDKTIRAAQQQSILTVTEVDAGVARGSVINFLTIDGRVRFDVSLDAAEKSNLKLSSKLLSVAHSVYRNPP